MLTEWRSGQSCGEVAHQRADRRDRVLMLPAGADGVIVGSRLVRAAGEAGSPQAAADAVGEFLSETRVRLGR